MGSTVSIYQVYVKLTTLLSYITMALVHL